MRDNIIRIVITVVAAIAFWILWGSPYKTFSWLILILIVLNWLTALPIKEPAKEEPEQKGTGFWVWANMGVFIALLVLMTIGIVLRYAAPPSTEPLTLELTQGDRIVETDDRGFCRDAMIAFIKARGIQWDDDGNKKTLLAAQEEELKEMVRLGIKNAKMVSDSFLDEIHPFLKDEFQNRLVQGWTLYLEGLETQDEITQAKGIRLLLEWEDFKADFIDLFYESIIK